MSDSNKYNSTSKTPWQKLLDFLNFRRVCEGVWVNSSPEDWCKWVLCDRTIIEVDVFEDSGGMFSKFELTVKDLYLKDDKHVYFKFVGRYPDEYDCGKYYYHRVKEDVYKYLSSYAEGDTWYDKANYGDEDDPLPGKKWLEAFGIDENVDKLPDEILNGYVKYPWHTFDLLDNIDHLPKGEMTFTGDTAESIKLAKQFALMALLDMQRYYYSAC
jgi:hypothetical protein